MKKTSDLKMMLLLGAMAALGPLAIDMYLPALPLIEQGLLTTEGAVQQSLMAFFLGLAFGQLFMGPLSDKFGRRKIILLGVGIHACAAFGCAFVSHIETLVALRALQGLGSAVGMSVGFAVVRDLYTGVQAAKLMAMIALVVSLAPVIAPAVGGLIVSHFPWAMIFIVSSFVALLVMSSVMVFLPETTQAVHREKFQLTQVFQKYGVLLSSPKFLPFVAVAALSQAGFFAYLSGASFFFIKLHGLAPFQFSLILAVNAVGMLISTQVNPRLLRWFGAIHVVRTAVTVYVLASIVLLLMAVMQVGVLVLYCIAIFIIVMTLPIIMPCCVMICMSAWGQIAGTASAMMGTLQFGAGALVTALVGIFANGTSVPMFLGMVLCSVSALTCIILFWPDRFEMPAQRVPLKQVSS